jgi:hypothetical protein
VCMVVHALNNSLAFVGMLVAPAAWQNQTMVSILGTGRYAGALAVSAGVLVGLLWWVRHTTRPGVPQQPDSL